MKRLNQDKIPCAGQGSGKKIILGVTGGLASGKSTVAAIFKSFGAQVIDADLIAHRLIRQGMPAYGRIVRAFGRGILKRDGAIDRTKLGRKAFATPRMLSRLNRIVHPGVIRAMKQKICVSSKKMIVLDVPLLIEAGIGGIVDKVIVVKADRKKQVERALKKYRVSREGLPAARRDILKRMDSQLSLSYKVRFADFIIDNNGTVRETRKKVWQIRRELWKDSM